MLPGDLGSVPGTHVATQNYPQFQFLGIWYPIFILFVCLVVFVGFLCWGLYPGPLVEQPILLTDPYTPAANGLKAKVRQLITSS